MNGSNLDIARQRLLAPAGLDESDLDRVFDVFLGLGRQDHQGVAGLAGGDLRRCPACRFCSDRGRQNCFLFGWTTPPEYTRYGQFQ